MVRTETYNRVSEFLKKYPLTIAFRLSKHVKILETLCCNNNTYAIS